LDNWCRR